MRTHSHIIEFSQRNRWLGFGLVLLTGLLLAPISPAETELEEQGRRVRTAPKGSLSSLDGIPLDPIPTEPRESGVRIDGRGRHLRAQPGSPVVIGHLGCPGCTAVLGSLGGLYLDAGRWWQRPGYPMRPGPGHPGWPDRPGVPDRPDRPERPKPRPRGGPGGR